MAGNRKATIILRRAPAGGITHETPNSIQTENVSRRYAGGQFIPDALWQHEKARAYAALPDCIGRFSDRFTYLVRVYEHMARNPAEGSDELLGATHRQSVAAIRDAYNEAFTLGRRAAGNLTLPTPDDHLAVGGVLDDELIYLSGFLADIRTNAGTMNYEHRADYYGKAARELFWLGFARADMSAMVEWRLGDTEHCDDCRGMADRGYMTVPDLLATGLMPQSGRLACLGYHCACYLEAGQ